MIINAYKMSRRTKTRYYEPVEEAACGNKINDKKSNDFACLMTNTNEV